MTEDQFPIRGGKVPYTDEADDVRGHVKRRDADAESAEGDDVQGHVKRRDADAEKPEGDDTEGHARRD